MLRRTDRFDRFHRRAGNQADKIEQAGKQALGMTVKRATGRSGGQAGGRVDGQTVGRPV